jgi:hypothetical protein
MPSRVYYRDRFRSRLGVGVSIVLLVVTVWFIVWAIANPGQLQSLLEETTRNRRLVVALPVALLAAPGLMGAIVLQGMRALDRRPLLMLSEDGLFYRDWRVGTIDWAYVLGYSLVEVDRRGTGSWARSDWFIEVQLRDPERYLALVHGGGSFSPAYRRSYFRILLEDVRAEREELRLALEAWISPAPGRTGGPAS